MQTGFSPVADCRSEQFRYIYKISGKSFLHFRIHKSGYRNLTDSILLR